MLNVHETRAGANLLTLYVNIHLVITSRSHMNKLNLENSPKKVRALIG